MYPLAEPELTLNSLVEHWLRVEPARLVYDDLLSVLLAAFWRDGLLLREPSGPSPWERRHVLNYVRRATPPDNKGMTFRTPDDGPAEPEIDFERQHGVGLTAQGNPGGRSCGLDGGGFASRLRGPGTV